jgi:hypothetical protein
VKTYEDALSADCVSLLRNPQLTASTALGTLKNVAVPAADGFTAAKKETSSTSSQSLKNNKQPLIGAGNFPTIGKWVKIKSPFVSRFAPEVLTTDTEISMLRQLKLASFTYPRLKTTMRHPFIRNSWH